jgi:hypothetical protein
MEEMKMNHSGIRIEIDTEENGYRVTRSKSMFAWSDKAIIMTLSDEIDKWIKTKTRSLSISICGTGTYNNYYNESIFRIIIDSWFAKMDIVTWTPGESTGASETFLDIKALKKQIKRQLCLLADKIDFQDHITA